MMNNGDEAARRAYERDQQTRMREAHEFKTYQEQQAFNARLAAERRRTEEERRKKNGGW